MNAKLRNSSIVFRPTPIMGWWRIPVRALFFGLLIGLATFQMLALPNITNVVETGGDDEPTDTVTAKWTGVTFANGVAGDLPQPYTVPFFGEDVFAYVDRNHQWNGAAANLPLPRYLSGGEYIMCGNDNRDNFSYQLDVTIAEESFVYVLVDNRLADGNNANPPDFTANMTWLIEQGWQPVLNGLNRAGDPTRPDEVGVDEGATSVGPGAGLDQWSSVYVKKIAAGTFSLFQPDNSGRNMYGVVIKEVPKTPVVTAAKGDLLGVVFDVTDGSVTALDPASITLKLDDVVVAHQANKNGNVTTIRYAANPPLASGSTHTAVLSFADNATPPLSASESLTFTVEDYVTVPPTFVVPAGGVDTSASGFKLRTVQANTASGTLPNTISRALAQLSGTLIDPTTGQPFVNEADLTLVGADGFFTDNNVINFDQDGVDHGNFTSVNGYTEELVPGIPGTGGHTDNFAVEILAYLQLSAGVHRMGVNSDDGFVVMVGPERPDALGTRLGFFDAGRGAADTIFNFFVEQEGFYPVRLVWFEGAVDANLEWFMIDVASGEKILINDPNKTKAVKAYRQSSITRPYVQSTRPAAGAAGVPVTATIEVKIVDGTIPVDANSVQLLLNDAAVGASVNKAGGVTTVSFDPPGNLASTTMHRVRIAYNELTTPPTARAAEFSFVTERPPVPVAYQQDQLGFVVMEAENFFANVPQGAHTWEFAQTPADYSGEGSMYALPEAGTTTGMPGALSTSPRLDFRINFSQTGTHYIWVRGSDGGGDSIHVGFNDEDPTGTNLDNIDEPSCCGNRATGGVSWVWINRTGAAGTEATIEVLTAGEHTLHVWMREDGMIVDKVIVTTDPTFVPTGQGPPESRRVGEAVPPIVKSLNPPTSGGNVAANSNIEVVILDGSRPLDLASIQFTVNGQPAAHTTSKTGNETTIRHDPPVDLPAGARVDFKVVVSDTATPPNTLTIESYFFTVRPPITDLFVQDANGLIAFEAENFHANADQGVHHWEFQATPADFSGDGTMYSLPENNVNIGMPVALTDSPRLDYRVQFVKTGTHYVWIRGSDGGGDSIHAGFDDRDPTGTTLDNIDEPGCCGNRLPGGETLVWINGTGTSPAERSIIDVSSAGEHTIRLWMREDGMIVDKVVITTDPAFVPAGKGPDETRGAPPRLTVSRTGGTITIEWTGSGTLEEADSVSGPWTDSANQNNPQNVTATAAAKFYRVKR
jgi:hypothetical protein